MKITCTIEGQPYEANLEQGIDLSIPLTHGQDNPNCYYADDPAFETIRTDDFVGSIKEGGRCNYQKVSLTPHGNGTHTECLAHVYEHPITIAQSLRSFFWVAEVISIVPTISQQDQILTLEDIKQQKKYRTDALIIRSLPNDQSKLKRKYSNTNPPFIEAIAATWLVQIGIKHLLVDLPSVDKEQDGGVLSFHKGFWSPMSQREDATITELIFVPDHVPDGRYLLNLQVPRWSIDAAPSRPILYKLQISM